ncbi:Group II intron, maturase-specific domain [Rhizobium tibeticum]|uniref:Group II intron, maturase-specific domain n=1 Tax=Rhizobium tibeticum TaxID=501024 RepID=A0A1H8PF59_9HYPH|nr:Group II intron, maturase-specific domain [Rhizobium tibeticum]SEO40441.1 Group II intron, maturase-specific domain [Rhizobium tibeticum]
MSLQDISRLFNPVLRGWVAYYGRFYPSATYPVFRHVNQTLIAWAMRKYRRLKRHKTRASPFLETVPEKQPRLFVHWQKEPSERLLAYSDEAGQSFRFHSGQHSDLKAAISRTDPGSV